MSQRVIDSLRDLEDVLYDRNCGSLMIGVWGEGVSRTFFRIAFLVPKL